MYTQEDLTDIHSLDRCKEDGEGECVRLGNCHDKNVTHPSVAGRWAAGARTSLSMDVELEMLGVQAEFSKVSV